MSLCTHGAFIGGANARIQFPGRRQLQRRSPIGAGLFREGLLVRRKPVYALVDLAYIKCLSFFLSISSMVSGYAYISQRWVFVPAPVVSLQEFLSF